MSTNQLAVVYGQRAQFSAAYSQGKISEADYNKAMAYTDSQIASLKQPTSTPSPMPSNPATTPLQASGDTVWVNSKYNVTKVEETPIGTAYTLVPKVPSAQTHSPSSLSERMLDVQTTPVFGLGGGALSGRSGSVSAGKPAPVRPLAPIAGIVASGESLVYFVPNVLGVKGTPQAPPTVTGGLVGKGIQGAAGLVGLNASSNELETVMLSDRYKGGYAVGSVLGDVLTSVAIGKAINYGVKSYKVVAPKVNAVAEKTASKVGYKIYDKGYNIIEPVYQKFNRVTSALDSADAKISQTYGAAKFKVSEPVLSGVARGKAEVQTFVSRASDLTFGGVKRVSPEVGSFGKSVVAPNIKQPQKIITPTLELANERYLAQPIDKARLNIANYSKPAINAIKLETMYHRVVTVPNAKNMANQFIKGSKAKLGTTADVLSKGRLEDQTVRTMQKASSKFEKQFFKSSSKTLKIKNTVFGKGNFGDFWKMTETKPKAPKIKYNYAEPRKLKVDSRVGVTSTKNISDFDALMSAKKITVRSKARSVKQLEDALPKDTPKVDAKQVTVQTQKTMFQPVKFKVSNMTSGGASRVVAGAYPGTKQRFREEEETTYLTMPKQALKLDKPQDTAIFQQTRNKALTETFALTKTLPSLGLQSKPVSLTPEVKITRTQNILPVTIPKMKQGTLPKEIVRQVPKTTPRLSPMQIPKLKAPLMPSISVGGGFDRAGPKGNKYGQWFEKKHKIKTYSQMLNTFGLGKASKPMRTIEKATNKLFKQSKSKRRKHR